MASFLIFNSIRKTPEFGMLITFDWLGSKGMFIAMLIGIATTMIFRFFGTKKYLNKNAEGVPQRIRSFEALIPGAVILNAQWNIHHLANVAFYDFVYKVLVLALKCIRNFIYRISIYSISTLFHGASWY